MMSKNTLIVKTSYPFTDEQKAWVAKFESDTTYECSMYIDDLERGEIKFHEFARRNLQWWRDHNLELERGLEGWPVEDDA